MDGDARVDAILVIDRRHRQQHAARAGIGDDRDSIFLGQVVGENVQRLLRESDLVVRAHRARHVDEEHERAWLALADGLRDEPPRDLAYRIAGRLAVDAPQQQALLELDSASARLEEETRILNRET